MLLEANISARTEQELLESCRRGDREAFRELFDLYKDRVYTIALRFSGNAATAEDIAQDTFVKLFSGIGAFRGEAGFSGWLYRMVVNSCFDHRRRARKWLPLLDVFQNKPAALDNALRSEASSQLAEALGRLPQDQRMIIVLRYPLEMSYEEIAAAMECSAGTVASRLHRAHKSLEKRLRKSHAELD